MSSQAGRVTARRVVIVLVAAWVVATASMASGQSTERFVLGPLQWTPTVQLREAGIDSNVFNTPTDAKSDVTGTFAPRVDSMLTLGVAQLNTQGSAEYNYFQKYTNERALNGRVSSRIVFPFTRIQPTATVSWAHAKDRTSNEIDARALHTDHGFGGALTTKLGQRIGLTATFDTQYTNYDAGQVFRGADLASELNRHSTNITGGLRFAATPLTSFTLDAGAGRDAFTLQGSRNTDNIRGNLGFEFAPDAVFAGHAQVGYHKMLPQHDSAIAGGALAFSGVTSSIDMSYTLLGRTRFNPRYSRDTTYSASVIQPYYLSTSVSLDILQTLYGPLALTVRGARDMMAYPTTAIAAARNDRADTLGGGISFRIATTGSVSINYDDSKRRSDAGPEFGYARRRVYTTVTYGF